MHEIVLSVLSYHNKSNKLLEGDFGYLSDMSKYINREQRALFVEHF